jgi:hypothetical protein
LLIQVPGQDKKKIGVEKLSNNETRTTTREYQTAAVYTENRNTAAEKARVLVE